MLGDARARQVTPKDTFGHHSGHQEKALANRGSACRERDERMTNLAIDPEFDLLRSDLANFEERVGILGRKIGRSSESR